ncbi:MAG: class I SAM-dependent methyltransferase [Anaerolineales bacterium]|nr:class I SAM-dependent methyltransferase [Anaerolineales bacterium]
MEKAALAHARVFNDEQQAERYAKGHQGMAEKFGREYADKLAAGGFRRGKIIDIGCGSGATGLVLAWRFVESEIVGIDLSEPLLRMANQRAAAAGLAERVRFEKADVQQIPYEDGAFDVAINANMVHLVEDPVRMLNEIERVLAPGGRLFIADLRRSRLGLIEREICSALTLAEAKVLFGRSALRPGAFSSGLLWWRFEA